MTLATTTAERAGMRPCPQCGNAGRKVKRVTLESVLCAERQADIGEGQYHVCTMPDCETVYFGPVNDATFMKSDLSVRFGLKETGPSRLACYCFEHTVEEIHDEIRRTGLSTVLESIKADMNALGCRCELMNPLGACCLNWVEAVVSEGFRSAGRR